MATYLYDIYVFVKFCDLWESIFIIPTLSSLNLKCLLIFLEKTIAPMSALGMQWFLVIRIVAGAMVSHGVWGVCGVGISLCEACTPTWSELHVLGSLWLGLFLDLDLLSLSHFVIDDSEGYNICCWISHWAFQWGKKFIFLWFLRIILLTLSNGK